MRHSTPEDDDEEFWSALRGNGIDFDGEDPVRDDPPPRRSESRRDRRERDEWDDQGAPNRADQTRIEPRQESPRRSAGTQYGGTQPRGTEYGGRQGRGTEYGGGRGRGTEYGSRRDDFDQYGADPYHEPENIPPELDPHDPVTYDLRSHPDLRYASDARASERDEAARHEGVRYESQPYRSASANQVPEDPPPPPRRGRRSRAVGKAKVGKSVGAVYQSGWVRAGDSASADDVGAIPVVSIVGMAQQAPGGLDQTGMLDLGGPILAEPEDERVEEGGTRAVAKSSAIMALGTIASRATGMLRTMVLGVVLGTFAVSNAYDLANQLPQQVYELLMGGVLSSVVVPLLVKAQKNDRDQGESFIQRLLTITVVLFTVMTAVIVLAAPLLTLLVTDSAARLKDPDQASLTTQFAYLFLLQILFYAMSAMFAAVLNSRGKFAPPAWIPVLNNLTVMATAGVFMVVHGSGFPTPQSITTTEVLILGVGTTFGLVLQTIALWIPLHRMGFRWKWRWDWRGTGLGEARSLAGWMLLYVALSQVGVMAIQKAANSPVATDPHLLANAAYNRAYMLFVLPHAIAAVSVITALLPRMSKAATEGRVRAIADDLALGTRLSSTLLIPATGILLFLGGPLGLLLFNYGNTSNGGEIGSVFAIGAIGLLPFSVSQIQTFVFYAMRDAKSPALINILVVAIRIVGAYLVVQLVPPAYVLHGLMVINAISYLVGMAVGATVLRRKLGPLHMGSTLANFGKVAAATLPAVLVAAGVSTVAQQFLGEEKLGSAVSLLFGVGLGGAIYVGLAMLFRVKEIQDVLGGFARKLKRG